MEDRGADGHGRGSRAIGDMTEWRKEVERGGGVWRRSREEEEEGCGVAGDLKWHSSNTSS